METKYYDLNQTCRACLCNDEALDKLIGMSDAITIGNKCLTAYQLLDELHFMDIFAVDFHDVFAQKICTKCFNFLVQIKEFIDICKTSIVTLGESINKNELSEATDIKFNSITIESVFLEQFEESDMKLSDEDYPNLDNESSELDERSTTTKMETRNREIIDSVKTDVDSSNQSTNEDSEWSNSDSEEAEQIIVDHPKRTQRFFINCTKCVSRFWKLSSFENHKNDLLCEAVAEYVCRYCGEKFELVETVESHLIELHPLDQPYYCRFCQINFSTQKILKDHIRKQHSNEKQFKCESCESSFVFKEQLHRHRTNVHTNKRFQCPNCNRQFKYRSKLNIHLKKHDPEAEKYKCSQCDREYFTNYERNDHERTHSNIKPFKCNICDKTFKGQGLLTHHLRSHDRDPNDRPFQCESCGKNFTSNGVLIQHMRRHSNDNFQYFCKICNRRFKILSSLTAHEKTHNEVRKHACDRCKCTFKYAHHLRAHIDGVHLKIKPFACTICDKTFYRSSCRDVHMRSHTGEKPFECTHCKKGFPGTQMLREHMRSHTRALTHKCEICSMGFMSHSHLSYHTLSKHQDGSGDMQEASSSNVL